MFRLITILLAVALLILTCGCNGAHETDEVAFVLAMWFDSTENGKLKITYEIALPIGVSSKDAGSSEAGGMSEKSSALTG